MTEHMGVSRFDPGRIRLFWTKLEADQTGQKTGSPVASCVFLTILSLFFGLRTLGTPLGPGMSLG